MADGFTDALVSNLTGSFGPTPPVYANPQFLDKNALDFRRRIAQQLMTPQPVHRWTQGLSNMANMLVGGNEMYQADRASQASLGAAADTASKFYTGTLGGVGSVPAVPPASGGGGTPSGAMSYTGQDSGTPPAPNDTAKTAMAFYQAKGLSPVAAAGLAGGFANEGGPASVAKGDGADGSDSLGIGQWNGPRAQALQQFAAANKLDPRDINTQLEFSWQELNGSEKGTLAALQAAKSPQDAAVAAAGYERPAGWTPNNPTGAAHFDRRLASTSALLGGGGGAIAAINGAAPGAQGGALPAGAMAFSGAQPAGQAPADGLGQPAQAPAGGMTAHDYGLIMANPNLPDSLKQAATALIQRQMVETPGGGHMFTSAMPGARRDVVNPGLVHSTFSSGPLNAPQGSAVDPVTGKLTTQPLVPGGDAAAPSSAPAGGQPASSSPYSGYDPMVRHAQGLEAEGAAKHATGAASGVDLSHDRTSAMSYYRTVFPLEHAIPALESLGKTGTGPGTEQRNDIKSFLQSIPGVGNILGIDPAKIQNFDEAKKYLTDYVNQTGNGGTNDKLAAAFAGNPNVGISNAAAVDVAKSALALQRMQQAKVLSFEHSGKPESEYSRYATDYASTMDPRAFGFDLMSPDARAKLMQSLPVGSSDRAQFLRSLRTAHDTGVIRPAQ